MDSNKAKAAAAAASVAISLVFMESNYVKNLALV